MDSFHVICVLTHKIMILFFACECKNIRLNRCHKVKRAFWLNTETVDEWDTADSLASGYGRYAKMFEVANMRELIGFIQEGIR